MPPIYIDNNATTRIAPEVFEAMLPYLTEFYGNPSSIHRVGARAAVAMKESREKVAAFFNCREAEVTFTPSREGFYRFEWSGDEDEPFPVRAETTVWVADPDTVDVGYHHGGVSIILDRDTFEAGRTVPGGGEPSG